MSVFQAVQLAPADPILGLTEAFRADPNPAKVNLGAGVYSDAEGRLPLLECVRLAATTVLAEPRPCDYLPINGSAPYNEATRQLVFGADSEAVAEGRIITVQTLGGTGALKVGADLLKRIVGQAELLISDPSWANHQQLFSAAGYRVGSYRYYDAVNRAVDVPAMLADLEAAAPGTIVLLHACCHNPTGYDLSSQQWALVIEVIARRGLVPFLDMAYQGFGDGLDQDAAAVRAFVEAGLSFVVASSYSKTFALYGERVGALSLVCTDADEATRVLSQVKSVIRTNYSNPPTRGAEIVATVLADPDLRALWLTEVRGMQDRIKQMRTELVAGLEAAGVQGMDHITAQRGMFSYSGLTSAQMARLRDDYSIYGTSTGRICVASLNQGNVEQVARAVAEVIKNS